MKHNRKVYREGGFLEKGRQSRPAGESGRKEKVLLAASVASMIVQFNMPNIRLLLEMGYEVHVACNLKEGNTCSVSRIQAWKAELEQMQVALYQWDCPRSAYAVGKCWHAYWQLWELAGRSPYAWIHCQSPVGGVLARLVAHQRGIGVVYTAHGFHFCQGAPGRNWLLYYPVEKLLSHWTDVLVTVNREDSLLARQNFHAGKNCAIPGIGVEVERFQAGARDRAVAKAGLRRQLGIPETAVLLLSVGELSRRKNHRAVLRVLAGLQREDVYYVICGQGPLRDELQRQAKRYGIADRVRMPGYMQDIRAAYQAADIFVFPSRQEGLPVALLEAMASGLPCIVSDIRGNRELIPWKKCRFAPGRPGQMRGLLLELIGDGRLRELYGKYNQTRVRAYDLQAVQQKMERIYRWMGHHGPGMPPGKRGRENTSKGSGQQPGTARAQRQGKQACNFCK